MMNLVPLLYLTVCYRIALISLHQLTVSCCCISYDSKAHQTGFYPYHGLSLTQFNLLHDLLLILAPLIRPPASDI
jgi:hypothetical protein